MRHPVPTRAHAARRCRSTLATLSAILTVAVASHAPAQAPACPPGWECIRADFRNLRGINYVPVFPQLAGTAGYHGVASPTALWHFYHQHPQNTARIDEQLDWVKRCGFNAVRVFLSSPAWTHYRNNPVNGQNQFLLNFADFVTRCHAKQLYVVPVFWSDVAVHGNQAIEPDFNDPVGLAAAPGADSNVSYWHRDPGNTAIIFTQALQRQGSPFVATLAGQYVAECVAAVPAASADAILLWDAMNEPAPLTAVFGDRELWVSDTLATIKSAPSTNGVSRRTTWSFQVTDEYDQSVNLARDPNCDVLSLHPYGHTRATITSFVYDATFETATSVFGKPLICTEIGYPGGGSSYRDTVGYCRWDPANSQSGVPRPDLDLLNNTTGEQGIGFMPWAFMIGQLDLTIPFVSNMPFKHGTGLFYHDGTVREIDAVGAFVELAVLQGIAPASLWQTPTNPGGSWSLTAKTTGPDWVDPWFAENVGPELDDHSMLQFLMTAPSGIWQSPWWTGQGWKWQDYERTAKLFRHVATLANVADGASKGNANPITATPRPAAHPVFTSTWPVSPWPVPHVQPVPSLSYFGAFAKFSADSNPALQAHADMLLDLEAHHSTLPALLGISGNPGWLQPSVPGPHQDLFVAIVVDDFLEEFALALSPLVAPRGGPF